MRTIAIVNLKGGVGKTVTSINMAAILAGAHQQRVLLIDADSQANSTEFFGGNPDNGTLAEVLQHDPQDSFFARCAIQKTPCMRVSLLAASDELMDLELSKIESQRVHATALLNMTVDLAESDLYDFVLIDCPPAFNAASAAALLAADEVIIPIKVDAFSLRGMNNIMRQIANMRRINTRLRVAGCLATMWYRDDTIGEALAQLHASSLPVFKTVIRRTAKVDKMTFAQKPLCIFSPRSSAGVDYRRFVNEYLGGGVTNG